MILVDIELEDFKQFHGLHRFTPPALGIVGILGDNGAGKTTLFQAIEWCLYQPAEFKAAEIPTRGQVAHPRVKVTLQDPTENVRYVIERRLEARRGTYSAAAQIYREGQEETPIVHGPRQVTAYVEKRLLGLSHRAFVTTFFTRQKELSFFGDLRETDRRREVGKLLGLETIRDAQKRIGEDRTAARAEAGQLAILYARRLGDRVLSAEVEEADTAIARQAHAVDAASEQLRIAAGTLTLARVQLTELQTTKDAHSALRQKLTEIEGEIKAAGSRRDSARDALALLDKSALQLDSLTPAAASELDLARKVDSFVLERDKAKRKVEVESSLSESTAHQKKLARELEQTVSSASSVVAGWSWRTEDARDPHNATARLISVIDKQDAAEAQARVTALESLFGALETQNREEEKLTKFVERLKLRERQKFDLLASGDPELTLTSIQSQQELTRSAIQEAQGQVQRAHQEIDRLTPLVNNLGLSRFDDGCPTCGRPFSEHEAAEALELFQSRIAEQREHTAKQGEVITRSEGSLKTLQREQAESVGRKTQLDEVNRHLHTGQALVREQEIVFVATREKCRNLMSEHRFEQLPTKSELDAARAHAKAIERLGQARSAIVQIQRQLRTEGEREQSARNELSTIGPATYDAQAHLHTQNALRTAQDAVVRIRTIETELKRRPNLEELLSGAESQLAQLASSREAVATEMQTLAFDPASLLQAERDAQSALDAEREALQRQAEAVGAHEREISARTRVLDDHAAINDLAKRSDERRRESDDLDRMYREFDKFEKFVAARLTPQLADHTAELLSQVTAGKYHRVELTDSFGIRVFDSDDESYPIEEFSGGERDVIALCARFALSNLIGGQAHRPPSFLVLDEVFGSLDTQRRLQLLETLGTLTGAADAFSQLFVISHVDDIRLSPVFDDLWKVTETAEGISRLENATTAIALAEEA